MSLSHEVRRGQRTESELAVIEVLLKSFEMDTLPAIEYAVTKAVVAAEPDPFPSAESA